MAFCVCSTAVGINCSVISLNLFGSLFTLCPGRPNFQRGSPSGGGVSTCKIGALRSGSSSLCVCTHLKSGTSVHERSDLHFRSRLLKKERLRLRPHKEVFYRNESETSGLLSFVPIFSPEAQWFVCFFFSLSEWTRFSLFSWFLSLPSVSLLPIFFSSHDVLPFPFSILIHLSSKAYGLLTVWWPVPF